MPVKRSPPLTRSKTVGALPSLSKLPEPSTPSKPPQSPTPGPGGSPLPEFANAPESPLRDITLQDISVISSSDTGMVRPSTQHGTREGTQPGGTAHAEEEDLYALNELLKNHREVYNFTRDVGTLALDGSNMSVWKRRAEEAVFEMTGVQGYWSVSMLDLDSRLDMAMDKCASRVIYTTIHSSLRDLISGISLAHARLEKLTSHFKQGSRTAQFSIFKSLVSMSFDPAHTPLMEHVGRVHQEVDRLESEGFKWTRDGFIGMIYQLGAPTTGDYNMDSVNTTLDAQFRTSGKHATAEDVRSVMQSIITNKKTALAAEGGVQVLATSVNRARDYAGAAQQQSSRRGWTAPPRFGGGPVRPAPQAIPAITPTRNEREASFIHPIDVPRGARREVHDRAPQCFYCGDFHHWAPECADRARRRPRRGLHGNDWRKTTSGYVYSIDALFPERFNRRDGGSAKAVAVDEITASAAAVSISREELGLEYAFLLDSGATHSVSNDRGAFINFTSVSPPISLTTATDGQKAAITGRGALRLATREGGVFLLDDVFYCGEATGTLIAQADLLEKGVVLSFEGDDVVVRLRDGSSMLARYRSRRWWLSGDGGAESVDARAADVSKEEVLVRLWHERFGHVDMKRIRKLCANQMGLSLPKSLPTSAFVCEDFLSCKSTRKRILGRTGRELRVLEVIFSDVMGPFREDLKGARFVVTFRDVQSTYSEVAILKQKSEVPDVFMAVLTRWEKEMGELVKVVRSDGGGEYMKVTFKRWLEEKGILHEQSNPYEPEQNGVADSQFGQVPK